MRDLHMYAVLFDIDGTLIKTGGAGKEAFLETFREDFGVGEAIDDVPFAGRSDRAITEDIMHVSGIENNEVNWQKFYVGYRVRLQQNLESLSGFVLPGVVSLIEKLKQLDHVLVGLLTGNILQGAQAKLNYYGIGHHFEVGGFGDKRTNRNDIAADARQAVQDHLASAHGRSLSNIMVIGDTPKDIECARSIDAFAVAVATGACTCEELKGCQPDLLLNDLTEPSAILAEIDAEVARNGDVATRT